MSRLKLDELAKSTDALTYLNGIKVSITELKSELLSQDELTQYMMESRERSKKLIRRIDGQYRFFARLVNKESPLATDITVDEAATEEFAQFEELMKNE